MHIGMNVRILSGNKIKFVCLVKSGSNVNIKWLINGKGIPRSSMYTVSGNTLTIKDTSKAGRFQVSCVVTGELESTPIVSNVEVIGVLILLSFFLIIFFILSYNEIIIIINRHY